MSFDDAVGSRGGRGRVVMLVDNAVKGDSRVQKAARSAADAGWEVILLGRGRPGQPESWKLGQAEVRLVPMAAPLAKHRRELRRVWQRGPLAYPPNGVAPYRAQQMKAWRTDLQVREDQLRLAAASGGDVQRLRWQQQMLRMERTAAGLTQKWVSFRYWQLTQGRRPGVTGWAR